MEVEVKGTDSHRANVEMEKTDDELLFHIKAEDFVYLRALTNSIMRLVDTSLKIAENI